MNKRDAAIIKEKLGEDGRMVVAHFDDYFKSGFVAGRSEIEYDSDCMNAVEKVLDAEKPEFKSIRMIKTLFPSVKKVFAYCVHYDGLYEGKEQLEANGWKVIQDGSIPMLDCSCYFVFMIPKNTSLKKFDKMVVEGITIYAYY